MYKRCYKSSQRSSWVDTHRQWCGASSGRPIRISLNNTGLTADGLWLISTNPLAAERSCYKRRPWNITYGHRRVWCNRKASLRPNAKAPSPEDSLEFSSTVAVNGLPVVLFCGNYTSHCFWLQPWHLQRREKQWAINFMKWSTLFSSSPGTSFGNICKKKK